MGAPAKEPPIVHSYSKPSVSVIIPVGPGHARHIVAALDSLVGQTFRNWEVIVVDDTRDAEEQELLHRLSETTYPFIALHQTTDGRHGAGAARNIGIGEARAPYVLFLDADDYLMPTALQRMIETLAENIDRARYVYSDWFAVRNGEYHHDKAPEYSQTGWFKNGIHAVTALIAIDDARGVSGFDEALVGWEDYDFFLKLAVSGVCGVRCPEPLLAYRQELGARREESLARKTEIAAVLEHRYGKFRDGGKPMGSCCGGNGRPIEDAKRYLGLLAPHPLEQLAQSAQQEPRGVQEPESMRMEFIGPEVGAISVRCKSGATYRGGNNTHDRYANVLRDDVQFLLDTGKWRIVSRPQPVSSPSPVPIPQTDPVHQEIIQPAQHTEAQHTEAQHTEAQPGDLTPRGLILIDEDDEAARAADEAARAHSAKRSKK